jgi:hypothetical protein
VEGMQERGEVGRGGRKGEGEGEGEEEKGRENEGKKD